VFAYVIPFGLLAAAVLSGLYVGLGLLSFWLTDATPVYWVTQKLLFTLGGLMLPLALYPEWVQRVAFVTPFPALLSGPAGFVIGASPSEAGELLLRLAFWGVLIFATVHVMFWRGTRSLQVNGG